MPSGAYNGHFHTTQASGLHVGDHLTELINCTGGNLESESPVFFCLGMFLGRGDNPAKKSVTLM